MSPTIMFYVKATLQKREILKKGWGGGGREGDIVPMTKEEPLTTTTSTTPTTTTTAPGCIKYLSSALSHVEGERGVGGFVAESPLGQKKATHKNCFR